MRQDIMYQHISMSTWGGYMTQFQCLFYEGA